MKLILGTMTFGEQVDEAGAAAMIDAFLDAGHDEIDTAHAYCAGRTEKMLGRLLPTDRRERVYLASKVNPWESGGLEPSSVERQFGEILERLDSDSIDLLYLHSPDLRTPVEETLATCFEFHRQGKFRDFGLSNFAAWQVAEVVEICRRNGWMVPTVYQGMYNALTRDVEPELFPCLRHYGLRFYAYNPLAGGLLTGKYASIEDVPTTGRFAIKTHYQDRYWKAAYFDVLREFAEACRQRELSPTQAALGWLLHHSRLDAASGDGVILGVTRLEQLQANLAAGAQPPLDPALVEILDRGWQIIKPNCFRYFRH